MKILVTGGASGLGEAISRRLAALPQTTVCITYRSSAAAAGTLQAEFPNIVAIPCDFTKAEDVAALCAWITVEQPDVLVNNAFSGAAIHTYFHKTPAETFRESFEHNLMPTIQVTQAAISAFRKKKSGKVITILSSFIMNTPPTGAAVYVAGKAYLSALTKVWANENIKFNITSNAISPAFMLTGLTADVDERLLEAMIGGHPLKRLLQPAEVAEAVCYLATASAQVNGTNMVINAGVTMQ